MDGGSLDEPGCFENGLVTASMSACGNGLSVRMVAANTTCNGSHRNPESSLSPYLDPEKESVVPSPGLNQRRALVSGMVWCVKLRALGRNGMRSLHMVYTMADILFAWFP